MSACTITSTGTITNDTPQDGASNPWECHDFIHNVSHTETVDYDSHVNWSLSGDVPLGLSIDALSGVISGNIQPLNYQDTNIVNDLAPKEVMKIDGSNHTMIGRPLSASYIFNFTIKRDYLVTVPVDPLLYPDGLKPESTTSNVAIMVIKNNDIDNLIFLKEYLNAGSSLVNNIDTPHTINVNGVSYTKETADECINNHPGPFGHCNIS